MPGFRLSDAPLDPAALVLELENFPSGALVSFEGRVRDSNEGRSVRGLSYQAYAPLALAEGAKILDEARRLYGIDRVLCVHRVGDLGLGETAVWVGVLAAHRDGAFGACRYVIDEIKLRVPIWKNEHYSDGCSGWLHPDGTPVGAKDATS